MEFIEGILEKYPAKWIKRVSIITIGQMLAQGIGFVFLVILARFYLKEDYGYLRYIINIGSFAAAVVSAGVPTSLARYFAKHKDNKELMDDYFSNGIAINIFLMACASVVLYAIYQEPLLLIIMLGYSVAGIYQGIIRGLILYGRIASFQFVINSLKIVIFLFLVYLLGFSDVKTPLIIYGATPFLVLLIYMIIFPLGLKFEIKRINREKAKEVSIFSSWVMISTIANSSIIMAITIALEHSWGFLEVATFSVAYSMITPFGLVVLGVNLILLPKIAETDDIIKQAHMVKLSLFYSVFVSLLFIIVYFLMGDWLIAFLFSSNYTMSYLPMIVMSIGALFMNVRSTFCAYFEGVGKPYIPTADIVTAAVISIIFSLIFVPIFGSIAAAWAILLGFIAACIIDILAWIVTRKRLFSI